MAARANDQNMKLCLKPGLEGRVRFLGHREELFTTCDRFGDPMWLPVAQRRGNWQGLLRNKVAYSSAYTVSSR
jgi:hypothetical protein